MSAIRFSCTSWSGAIKKGNSNLSKIGGILIKHIVMWSMKKDSDLALKIGNAMEVKRRLESLKPNIFEIKKFEVGVNFSNSLSAYDIVLYSEFKNREDLAHYMGHPKHVIVKEYIDNVTGDHHVVDYEI